MSQEPEKKWSRIYELTKHPLIYVLLAAFLGGHLVLQISVPQWGLWLFLLNIVLIIGVMVISFILGVGFLPVYILSNLANTKMPWPYRVIVSIMSVVMAPFLWLSEWRKEQKPPSEADKNVQAIITRIRTNAEKGQNEPPTPSTH